MTFHLQLLPSSALPNLSVTLKLREKVSLKLKGNSQEALCQKISVCKKMTPFIPALIVSLSACMPVNYDFTFQLNLGDSIQCFKLKLMTDIKEKLFKEICHGKPYVTHFIPALIISLLPPSCCRILSSTFTRPMIFKDDIDCWMSWL